MSDNLLDQARAQKDAPFGYRVAEWTLSIHANRLTKDAGAVDLEYRQTRILVYLMERPHQIISKDELIKTIWEKKVVNEESLPVAISQIRKALNDDARTPRFIKTIPGVGYQFIADPIPLNLPVRQSFFLYRARKFRIALTVGFICLISIVAWKLGQESSAHKDTSVIEEVSSCGSRTFAP